MASCGIVLIHNTISCLLAIKDKHKLILPHNQSINNQSMKALATLPWCSRQKCLMMIDCQTVNLSHCDCLVFFPCGLVWSISWVFSTRSCGIIIMRPNALIDHVSSLMDGLSHCSNTHQNHPQVLGRFSHQASFKRK